MAHGPLMISGFLGTLITLERVVALKQKWMFAAPVFTAAGWISLLIFPTFFPGAVLITLGSLGAVGILAVMAHRETKIHTVTMLLGALIWFFSNVLWIAGLPIFKIVFLWQAFLVLTIVGERLELNRVLRPSRKTIQLFIAAAAIYLVGVLMTPFLLNWGTRLAGVGMIFLSAWLLRYDLAKRNLRHRLPLTRYIAWCLYLGFIWLGISGGLSLFFGAQVVGPYYDATIHAVFVGFVISMIFGHAPIIFPAILGIPITYNRGFYVQLILLHLSLLIRIGGDLTNNLVIRQWGGLLNEVALLIFLGMTIVSVKKGYRT